MRKHRYICSAAIATWIVWITPFVESIHVSPTIRTDASRVIVVGKVIIDEYGKPDDGPGILSIGGGGPQAAFGAALALATLSNDTSDPPQKQPITFVGPVGGDWSDSDATALDSMLGSALESVVMIQGLGLRTPRIQLWHDDLQNVVWRPIHDSFGPQGADALWDNRPSAMDMLSLIGDDEYVSCHVVLEAGTQRPGQGGDVQFLHDDSVRKRLSFLGVEPVAFAEAGSVRVSQVDADCIVSRLSSLSPVLRLVSPDNQIYEAIPLSFWTRYEVGIRKGPMGSTILEESRLAAVPAATLVTPNGAPVNPTGAGNAYAGAMTALRSQGVSLLDAACIASAVGAVFCEYDHIPPWSSSVISRVRQATAEVREKLPAC